MNNNLVGIETKHGFDNICNDYKRMRSSFV